MQAARRASRARDLSGYFLVAALHTPPGYVFLTKGIQGTDARRHTINCA